MTDPTQPPPFNVGRKLYERKSIQDENGYQIPAVLSEATTLRDQFAMAAMTGLMAINPAAGSLAGIAEFSYIAADAMLKAREAK